jgi:hypothetical protein
MKIFFLALSILTCLTSNPSHSQWAPDGPMLHYTINELFTKGKLTEKELIKSINTKMQYGKKYKLETVKIAPEVLTHLNNGTWESNPLQLQQEQMFSEFTYVFLHDSSFAVTLYFPEGHGSICSIQ